MHTAIEGNEAQSEYFSRPKEERFWGVDDALEAALEVRDKTTEVDWHTSNMSIETTDEEFWVEDPKTEDRFLRKGLRLILKGSNHEELLFTNFSFSQFVKKIKAGPISYLATLPTDIVCDILNYHIRTTSAASFDNYIKTSRYTGDSSLLIRSSETMNEYLMSILSSSYERTWDSEILQEVKDHMGDNWRVPPARAYTGDPRAKVATAEDCLSTATPMGVHEGDMISPAGAYVSDRDSFLYLVNDKDYVEVPDADPLFSGIILSNSIVGDRAFFSSRFLHNGPCANHLLIGLKDAKANKTIHRGVDSRWEIKHNIRSAFSLDGAESWQNTDAFDKGGIESGIKRLHDFKLKDRYSNPFSPTGRKMAVLAPLETLMGKSNKKMLGDAYDLAEAHPEDGHKGSDTAWGMIQGLTRLSQQSGYQSEREAIDILANNVAREYAGSFAKHF